jgi:hypothetical protein
MLAGIMGPIAWRGNYRIGVSRFVDLTNLLLVAGEKVSKSAGRGTVLICAAKGAGHEPSLDRRGCLRARQRAVGALRAAGRVRGGFGPPLKVAPPPRSFASSEEHYKYLLTQAKGGTKHTITSVPRWDGLWVTAGNTHMDIFIDPPGSSARSARAC